jgi:hypothetical protein
MVEKEKKKRFGKQNIDGEELESKTSFNRSQGISNPKEGKKKPNKNRHSSE